MLRAGATRRAAAAFSSTRTTRSSIRGCYRRSSSRTRARSARSSPCSRFTCIRIRSRRWSPPLRSSIAGGFKNDLTALNDSTPHDERYDRLVEYTLIIKRLLAGEMVSFEGKFYRIDKLKLSSAPPPELFPGIFISGSSDAGMAAALAIGCTAIKYPRPPWEEDSVLACGTECGVRVGVIAREREDDAWAFAYREFPEDRKGQLTRQLATKVSDSLWHRQLAGLEKASERSPYWLVPFQNYKTMCPYLVGSYDTVAAEIARYLASGYTTFILDIPRGADELNHSRIAFDRALRPLA